MFKIGKPVYHLPPKRPSSDEGKYGDIYKVVDRLHNGDWLPVTFESAKDAYNFRITCETHRTRLLQATTRGATVYVRNRK